MDKKITTRELILSGLFLSSGIILPMMFHLFGMTGPIFLPMHIPVLMGGFFLHPKLSFAVGVLTPLISSAATGMPVMFPMAPIMAVELGIYGLVSSVAFNRLKLNPIASLLIAMIAGRIASGFTVAFLSNIFGVQMNAFIYLKGAILTGIPGMIIQIIFIPSIVYAVKRILQID